MSGSDQPRPAVLLGVAGGIAAYKACELLRALTEGGCDVRVVPTASALRFVGAATFEALSGHPVTTQVWDDVDTVAHVRLGQRADLVVVAPATADLLARVAAGRADDLLTASLLVARCPVVLAPAMHSEMWQHPATVANIATLRERGVIVLEPAVGRLTGADSGPGRLPEPAAIAAYARAVLSAGGRRDLVGRHVVVSAGGTREPLDPVRYLGNRSSGRQGSALALAAAARGARVTLVVANPTGPAPHGVEVVPVGTAAELREAVLAAAADADLVVMAAAVADFRPVAPRTNKIKKDGATPSPLELELTADVLAELSGPRRVAGQVVVGFAAETGEPGRGVLELAAAKLARKGCDLLVVNEVGPAGHATGFESEHNAVTVLAPDSEPVTIPYGRKDEVARAILDLAVARLDLAVARLA